MSKHTPEREALIQDTIFLPFEWYADKPSTDALHDLHLRFTHLVNYLGELLLATHFFRIQEPQTGTIKVNIKTGLTLSDTCPAPKISINKLDWPKVRNDLARQLFESSTVQLATIYEVYLTDLLEDILWRNEEWLFIEEKQLTTADIFRLGSIEDIREQLIEKKKLNFAMMAYPQKVDKFQREFHVGIHSDRSPHSLFEMHDFIEVRNVIVHNNGYASDQYLKRISGYDKKPLIAGRYQSLKVDFTWLLNFGFKVVALCQFIDQEVNNKLKTTANSRSLLFRCT